MLLTSILVLSVGQFQRFMEVIKKLAERVEKEHNQFLRDSQRLDDRSGIAPDGTPAQNTTSTVDFESLVGRSNGATVKADTVIDNNNAAWDDDVWGSIFSNNSVRTSINGRTIPLNHFVQTSTPINTSPPPAPSHSSPSMSSPSPTNPTSRNSPFQARPSKLGSFSDTTSATAPSVSTYRRAESKTTNIHSSKPSVDTSQAIHTPNLFPPPPRVQPMVSPPNPPKPLHSFTQPTNTPNYNIYSSPAITAPTLPSLPPPINQPPPFAPQQFSMIQPALPLQPLMGGLLTPSRPAQSSVTKPTQLSKDDWGDFDPLA